MPSPQRGEPGQQVTITFGGVMDERRRILNQQFPALEVLLDPERFFWFNAFIVHKKNGQHAQEYLDRALY